MKTTKYTAKPKAIKANSEVEVAPEAAELLFETEDVADIIAEATGEVVTAEAEEDIVTFTIGEGEEAEVIVAEAEGTEEVLEASTKVVGKKVTASTRRRVVKRK